MTAAADVVSVEWTEGKVTGTIRITQSLRYVSLSYSATVRPDWERCQSNESSMERYTEKKVQGKLVDEY